MKLFGKRIMVFKPEVKQSPLQLDEASKMALEREAAKTWTSLEISHVGDEVTKFNVGDKVYISTQALSSSEVIDIENKLHILVNEASIILAW